MENNITKVEPKNIELKPKAKVTIEGLVHNQEFLKKAQDVLGQGTQQFMSSVLTLSNSDKNFKQCDTIKLYNCCLMAAAIKLPFNQSLGQAYVIAYKGEPQLQIGYKGFIQLAQRSGQFKTINATEVKEGEVKNRNRLTGDIEFDWIEDEEEREKAKTIGYVAYFELLNGYHQTLYMSAQEIRGYATKYSQSFKFGGGVWKDNFDEMAKKTVLKRILSKYAPLSIDMQKAIEIDQSDGDKNYPDSPKETLNVETFNAEEAEVISE